MTDAMDVRTIASRLSPRQKEFLRKMPLSAGVENPTMCALKKRGLVEWWRSSWGNRVRGEWGRTNRGNLVAEAIDRYRESKP